MNILHISLEDFSTAASPVFANEHVRGDASNSANSHAAEPSTPNLARLAARGAVFRRAYCQSPICNPSRTSIMTSRRPASTNVYTNEDAYRAHVPRDMPSLVDFLRAAAPSASVACASGSKLFHVACDKDAMGMDAAPMTIEPSALPPAVRVAAAFIVAPPGAYSADQYRARVALARLVRYASTGQRFYLGVGLVETHADQHRVCHIDVVPPSARRPAAASPASRMTERLPPLVTWPNFDFWQTQTEDQRRLAIGLYYGCATHVDGTIGALIGSLEALGLSQTTAIVVHGDHGYSLGRHGRWSKYNLYEDAARVPLIIAVPGARARVIDDVIESLDVLPTILDLWGVRRVPAGATRAPSQSFAEAAAHYELHGRAVPLEGESLLTYLWPGHRELGRTQQLSRLAAVHTATSTDADTASSTASLPSPYVRRRRRYARSELHLPCGLGCVMLNQPYDGLPPGYTRTPKVGAVVQLSIRTRRWACIATLTGELRSSGAHRPTLRIIDDALFDVSVDPAETANLAYFPAHAHTRQRLLHLMLDEWNLRVSSPLNETRWQRAEWLREQTGFRPNWWKR